VRHRKDRESAWEGQLRSSKREEKWKDLRRETQEGKRRILTIEEEGRLGIVPESRHGITLVLKRSKQQGRESPYQSCPRSFKQREKKSAYDVGSVIKRQRKRARDGAVVDDLGRRGTRLERGGRRDGGGEGEGGEEGGGEHAGAVIEDCRVRVGKGRCCWLMRRVVTWQEDVLYAARDDADD
jgi:hypothetical protein